MNPTGTEGSKEKKIDNTVGSRIKKLREERGIKQAYIANEIDGLTQSNYGRLEKDDERLNVPKLIKIAEVLKVSISDLFGEKAGNVIHEIHGNHTQAQIGTIIQQDKDYIASLKEENGFLKEEIMFLRKMLDAKPG